MNRKLDNFNPVGAGLLPLLLLATGWGQTAVAAQQTPLPKLKTVFYTIYHSTANDRGGFLTSMSLQEIRLKSVENSPEQFVIEQKLFQADEEAGIHAIYPSPDFSQVIATFQHADFSLLTMQINDLEWVSAGGKSKKRLTKDMGGYKHITWSPDQKKIAYASRQGTAWTIDINKYVEWAVYAQEVSTGRRKKLFQEGMAPPDDPFPGTPPYVHWLSQTQLLYASQHPKGIFLLDTTGKKPVRLTENVPSDLSLENHLAFWHDYETKQIRTATLPTEISSLTQPQTWNALKSGEPFTFPQFPDDISFSTDHHTAAMIVPFDTDSQAPQRLILLDFKTRKIRLLGVSDKQIAGLQWSKDGKFVTCFLDNYASAKHDSIVAIPVPPGEGVPFEQFDWKLKTSLKWTEIFALPVGALGARWKE